MQKKETYEMLYRASSGIGSLITAGISGVMISRIISGKKFGKFLKWLATVWLVQLGIRKYNNGLKALERLVSLLLERYYFRAEMI